jgi:hypothetical protein
MGEAVMGIRFLRQLMTVAVAGVGVFVGPMSHAIADNQPVLTSSNPPQGGQSGGTVISATFNEEIGPSSTAHVYEETNGVRGSEVPAASVKTTASSSDAGAPVDTIVFTPAQIPLPVQGYLAIFRAVPRAGTPPADDPTKASTIYIHFAVSHVAPDLPNTAPPMAINENNQAAVPFTGTSPAGEVIKVVIADTSHPGAGGQPGPYDAAGSTTVAPCATLACPYTVLVDTTKSGPAQNTASPDTSSTLAPHYQWTATATNAAGSTSNQPQPIIKDTSPPAAPTNPADSIVNNSSDRTADLSVSAQHTADIHHYLVIVTDSAGGPPLTGTFVPDGNFGLSASIDVSGLADGTLQPEIAAVDEAGNISGSANPTSPLDSLTVVKESVPTQPDLAASTFTVDGQNVPLSQSIIATPEKLNIVFDEPIRLSWDSDESNQVSGPVIKRAGVCVADAHGLCLAGVPSASTDGRTLTWTPSSPLPGGRYTVTSVKAFAQSQTSCPDADPTFDPKPSSCESYDSSLPTASPQDPLASFTVAHPSVLSISARPSTLTYGTSTTLSGRLWRSDDSSALANRSIALTVSQAGTAIRVITAVTNGTGQWSVQLRLAHNATFSARFVGDQLDTPAVARTRAFVRTAVLLGAPSAATTSHRSVVTISGRVAPSLAGATITFYERRGTSTILLGRVTSTSRSTFAFRHLYGAGTHNVFAVIASSRYNAAGVSNHVRFTRT